ncbi:YlbF family regulator [Companilactobacillus sp. DQM5]|uniref:YlbF family regulator n=1 Tax=Companilactobacillus sp. DQM5 TaxID=3463359 RepID=UPI004057E64A
MINIYDTANQMATDLDQVEQVKHLKDVFAKLKADEGAYEIFDKVQNLQYELQQKQMSGQEITQENIDEMKSYTDKFNDFPIINELMESEKKVNDLINELNQIITKPIADIYSTK